jgi:hypothetical protein
MRGDDVCAHYRGVLPHQPMRRLDVPDRRQPYGQRIPQYTTCNTSPNRPPVLCKMKYEPLKQTRLMPIISYPDGTPTATQGSVQGDFARITMTLMIM